MLSSQPEWDQRRIEKYNGAGPRYTSYPTALEFSDAFDEAAFLHAVAHSPQRPLSLYVHIPFCHRLCYFCGCNKIVTRHPHKADRYLDALEKEIRHRAPLFVGREVVQLHWGGGTPTFLNPQQISRLMALLRTHFTFADAPEMSIEVDPREIPLEVIDHLRAEGFTRLSIGVQDFTPEVQARVNRVQDEAVLSALITRARAQHFHSISLDLIYGLPLQTPASFALTLQKVLALNPDRLSVFNYAHMPALFAAQRKIKQEELPGAAQKLQILQHTIATLTQAGYQFIGMDHFAKPEDELAVAQRAGLLHRNFQGYTTRGDSDLLGLGVSAISTLGDSYLQNHKDLNSYYRSVEQRGDARWRGVRLSEDDLMRRDVIKRLMCHFSLDFAAIESQWPITFERYFAEDLALLAPLEADGLLFVRDRQIQVTAVGRLLIRALCMCFDRYLRQRAQPQAFSRVI